MDPAVPWTAYAAAASYNRLANATASGFQTTAADFQNSALAGHQNSASTQSSTNQLILQAAHTTATLAGQLGQGTTFTPPGFLSSPAVGYDSVFSPLFHHANPKAAAAAAHFRKQSSDGELTTLHPQGSYFDTQSSSPSGAGWAQNNSQLPSPFGILPHESVVPNTTGTAKSGGTAYENTFAAQHFAAQGLNHLNSQLSEFAKGKAPPRTPAGSYSSGQQSCIVSSASSSPNQNKAEYRIPQSPARGTTTYNNNQRPTASAQKSEPASRSFTSPPAKPATQQPAPSQTQQHVGPPKAQNKAERRAAAESLETSQSSPISFAVNYPSNPPSKTIQRTAPASASTIPGQYVVTQNYRKTGSADSAYSSSSNGPECNAAVPRRPSPLQAHSQASPLGTASSPAYPIYNSPSAVSQVTPPSPLDASVSRGSAIGYSSVITRADGRWESEARNAVNTQARNKFPSGYGLESGQPQRSPALNITERQQAYFDNTPAGDLSSCRGDPMSIVKNLQNLQNCSSVPELTKVELDRSPPKNNQKGRRKSGEKFMEHSGPAVAVELLTGGKIPPPAHLNHPGQQAQNGGYFEVDRWNLATPKMYNQHQGLIHHPPPPLPYFPPFHIPPGHHPHPQDFHPGVDISHVNYPEASYHTLEVKEENPKVVVPNVEEELQYLSQQAHAQVVMATKQQNNANPTTVLPPPIKQPPKKPEGGDPNAGFMASYLKFLQGERDTSPPPPVRANRKAVWTKNKVYPPDVKNGNPSGSEEATSGMTNMTPSNPNPASAISPAVISHPYTVLKKGNEKTYSPASGPRVVAPKTIPKRKLSDSESSGDEGGKKQKTYTQMKTVTSAQLAQISRSQPSLATGAQKKQGRATNKKSNKSVSFAPPRRETTQRKAKERSTIKKFLEKENLDQDEEQDADDPDFAGDSDSDPVWVPGANPEDEDDKIKRKKPRNLMGKGKRRTADGDFADSSDEDSGKPKKGHGHISSKNAKTKGTTDVKSEKKEEASNSASSSDPDALYNKTGEFVVMKSDLHEEYPPIWRIDGKTLLQKYEPFDENGKTLYRNISTYSGWTSQNKHIYVTVPVKFRVQTRTETIVELMKDQMNIEDPELMERVMKDLEKYQDSFEVYIQTLISQALDANFLSEILQEQDDYFLSNVKTIDDVTEDHCRRLLGVTKWKINVINAFKTLPAVNILQDLPKDQMSGQPCGGCDKLKVSMRIQVYGQPYNAITLDGCQPDSNAPVEKDFLFCSGCGWRISLFNKATHQKYLMFIECAKRVAEKRNAEPGKDTTIILNELLADEPWLNQLFLEVRKTWAEIEKVEHLSCESNKHLLQNAVASAGIL